GVNTVELTFDGAPVRIPVEFLDTVQFKAPRDASGAFRIKVEALTRDYDDDAEGIGTPVEAVSGVAWLDGIVFTPQAEAADRYKLAVTPARGFEDGGRDVGYEGWKGIPFTVKVASTDPSETFDITISGIPVGATLYLNGVALDAVDGGSVTIVNFVNTHELSVKPTEHYSGTFNLEVTASVFDTDVAGNRVQLDTAGHEWAVQTVPVQVIGVADVVTGLVAET